LTALVVLRLTCGWWCSPEQDHVPVALGAIIADCLSSEPKDRPSARQVYDRLSALVRPRAQRQASSPQTVVFTPAPTPDIPNPPPTPLNLPNEFFPRSTTGIAGALAAASRATNPQLAARQRKTLSPFAAHGAVLAVQPHAPNLDERTGDQSLIITDGNTCSNPVRPSHSLPHPSPFAQLTQDPFSSGSNELKDPQGSTESGNIVP
jgi:hypothetical protein